jgi:predicted dehydrogenase
MLRSVVGYYNKGLLNNGSHLLDLLHLLLGSLRVVHAGKPVEDFSADDPSVPAWLEGPGGLPVHIACAHAADFAFFELQLVFARAVIAMEEGGLYWRERITDDSAAFAGYRVPGEGVRRSGGYHQAMLRSVDNIFGAVQRRDPLASTGETALAAQRLCEEIRRL